MINFCVESATIASMTINIQFSKMRNDVEQLNSWQIHEIKFVKISTKYNSMRNYRISKIFASLKSQKLIYNLYNFYVQIHTSK